MKILQVNTTDLLGGRFNGRALNFYLREKGHEATQCVWSKQGRDDHTWILGHLFVIFDRFIIRKLINYGFRIFEKILSIQSLVYPWGLQLLWDRRFKSADVVHYHLLHNGYFSLPLLPILTRMRPSIWTIHDPWAMTGHCVYPQECTKWLNGCDPCSDIKKFIPVFFDNAGVLFKIKKKIYQRSTLDLVFASKFMFDMAKSSPLFEGMRMHYIPFGIDLKVFLKKDKKEIRARFGIPYGNFVISFRSTTYEYKGLNYIKDALLKLSRIVDTQKITLLTVNDKGHLADFSDWYNIVELGSVSGDSDLSDFYNASDIFLMPSTGEAFGMMAIESMACGTPVVVFEGTSLPDVVFAPKGGISVPMRDADALCAAIKRLKENPAERKLIGDAAFDLAREHYDFNVHAEKIMSLYETVIQRRNSPASN